MLRSFEDHLDGIIYHTVKFCDNYSYEYAALYDNISASIQKFETDATSQCEGQIRTSGSIFRISADRERSSDIRNQPKGRQKGTTYGWKNTCARD